MRVRSIHSNQYCKTTCVEIPMSQHFKQAGARTIKMIKHLELISSPNRNRHINLVSERIALKTVLPQNLKQICELFEDSEVHPLKRT